MVGLEATVPETADLSDIGGLLSVHDETTVTMPIIKVARDLVWIE